MVPRLEALQGPSHPFAPSQDCVYLDLNRNQTAMPPSFFSATTPAQDNEDLLVLSREPADTKRTASQSPALECSKLKHRRAGTPAGGPGLGVGGVGGSLEGWD